VTAVHCARGLGPYHRPHEDYQKWLPLFDTNGQIPERSLNS